MSELSTLIKEAREDPTLFSTIDVDTLLDKIDENHFLENKQSLVQILKKYVCVYLVINLLTDYATFD